MKLFSSCRECSAVGSRAGSGRAIRFMDKQYSVRKVGRHFPQIPDPTNVPDRILQAIDQPTIDHRGPEFSKLGQACLQGDV
jgi:hypothetical protein